MNKLTESGILLPYQKKWAMDPSQVKVARKSRQIGFSWMVAGLKSLKAASKNGRNTSYMGYEKEMTQGFIEDCAWWSKIYNLASSDIKEYVFEDERKDITTFEIRYASGHKITALSSCPRNFRSRRGDVVLDEAAFHDDLEAAMTACRALMIWGGDIDIFSSENGEDSEFHELCTDIDKGKLPYSLHTVTFDDAIKDGLYKKICEKTGQKWTLKGQILWRENIIKSYGSGADQELFCIASGGDGIWMPRIVYESCISPDVTILRHRVKDEFTVASEYTRISETNDWMKHRLDPILEKIGKSTQIWFGEDFGRTGTLTVIWLLTPAGNLRYHTPLIIELGNIPHEQQKQILFHILDWFPRFRAGAMDSRGNGDYLAEVTMQKYGAERIEKVMLSEGWYRENMPGYKSAYEDKSITCPSDDDILDDHRGIKVVKGVAKPPEGILYKDSQGHKRHCDSTVAGALAWYAMKKKDSGPIEFKSTGIKHIGSSKSMKNFMGRSH